jgi:putative transposase
MVMSNPPKLAVSDVVGKIKWMTASWLRKKFSWLSRVFWKENIIQSPGYFVSTVGLDEKKILEYVQWQQNQDLGQVKLEFLVSATALA